MTRNATASLPRAEPVLRADGLVKHYGQGEGCVCALDAVELEVAPGETLAVPSSRSLRPNMHEGTARLVKRWVGFEPTNTG
jgi:hypothetical protein